VQKPLKKRVYREGRTEDLGERRKDLKSLVGIEIADGKLAQEKRG